jgi:hypothetical protein
MLENVKFGEHVNNDENRGYVQKFLMDKNAE